MNRRWYFLCFVARVAEAIGLHRLHLYAIARHRQDIHRDAMAWPEAAR